MSEEARHQLAICDLLLKGEHWISLAPGRRLCAADRSSPEGPVNMTELIAAAEDCRIAGWSKVGTLSEMSDATSRSRLPTSESLRP
jgi:hypothetical protein